MIGEAEPLNGRRMMLCQCECGNTKAVDLGNLRQGKSRTCGCWYREIVPEGTKVNRCEVPLYGKAAAGRVALIDEEDYELVSQYRWHVVEQPQGERRRSRGPYARTNTGQGGGLVFMHTLITGWPFVDHADHNGLNNRKYNLREATRQLNSANARKKPGGKSPYKGVAPWKARWNAHIRVDGRLRHLGYFPDAESAARAYDAAARDAWGEYACLNFPDKENA